MIFLNVYLFKEYSSLTEIDSASANLQHCKNKTNWKKITHTKNKQGKLCSFLIQLKKNVEYKMNCRVKKCIVLKGTSTKGTYIIKH